MPPPVFQLLVSSPIFISNGNTLKRTAEVVRCGDYRSRGVTSTDAAYFMGPLPDINLKCAHA
jgi:hypothetical protein